MTTWRSKGGRGTLIRLVAFVALFAGAAGARAMAEGAPSCEDLHLSGSHAGSNIILIVNDATRRDRIGIYGGPARTPAFDAFARANLLFEQAFTQAPWTSPSISTLFTSMFPSQHGVLSNPKARQRIAPTLSEPLPRIDVLSDGFTTLAEVLRASGYRTAAFVGNPWLQRRFGFDQGFEVYDDSFASWEVPGDVIAGAAIRWLDGLAPGDRYFLYLHLMDTHRPYAKLSRKEIADRAQELRDDRRPLTARARITISELIRLDDGLPATDAGIPPSIALLEMSYDQGVHEFDTALAGFLEKISARPAYDRTAIIVTADHGEALFARGYDNHGNGLYDDELAIPFAARLPGVTAAGSRVRCPFGLIDVMPTLCDYVGVGCPKPIFGTSLLDRSARKEATPARVVTEGVMFKPRNRALRDGTWKLLWQPQGGADGRGHELFDISKDPGELRDLLSPEYRTDESARVFDRMSRAVLEAVPAFARPQKVTAPLDPELEKRLKSLGYIQ